MDAQQQPTDPADPAFTRSLLDGLVRGTRQSNQLPGDAQRDYANTFPAFQSQMQGMGQRIGGMLQGFVDQHAQHGGGSSTNPSGGGFVPDDMTDRFDAIVDLTDRMLERVDADLERHQALGAGAPQRALGGGAIHGGQSQGQQGAQQQQAQAQVQRMGQRQQQPQPQPAAGGGSSLPMKTPSLAKARLESISRKPL